MPSSFCATNIQKPNAVEWFSQFIIISLLLIIISLLLIIISLLLITRIALKYTFVHPVHFFVLQSLRRQHGESVTIWSLELYVTIWSLELYILHSDIFIVCLCF